jgi:hypothetical protein
VSLRSVIGQDAIRAYRHICAPCRPHTLPDIGVQICMAEGASRRVGLNAGGVRKQVVSQRISTPNATICLRGWEVSGAEGSKPCASRDRFLFFPL